MFGNNNVGPGGYDAAEELDRRLWDKYSAKNRE